MCYKRLALCLTIVSPIFLSGASEGSREGEIAKKDRPVAKSRSECIECHAEKSDKHIAEWRDSPHYKANLSCVSCHNPNAITPTCKGGISEGKTPSEKAEVVTKLCGGCHYQPMSSFIESKHYKESLKTKGVDSPTCVTCHSDIGTKVLREEEIKSNCASCHSVGGAAGKAWAAAEAISALEILREVALAKALVAERIEALRLSGRNVSQYAVGYEEVKRDSGDIVSEWHRFDIKATKVRSVAALERLESIYKEMGGK
ncbi:MAG: hypothetical protein Kow0090_12780 [Myxococcota bacterium]